MMGIALVSSCGLLSSFPCYTMHRLCLAFVSPQLFHCIDYDHLHQTLTQAEEVVREAKCAFLILITNVCELKCTLSYIDTPFVLAWQIRFT